jgi:hypothetical protein
VEVLDLPFVLRPAGDVTSVVKHEVLPPRRQAT